MIHRSLCVASFLVCCTFAGCANYDFAKAKMPNGEWDMVKLIADLKASGKDQLSSGLWIPLLYLDLTTFGPSRPNLMLDAYTLEELTAIAPIFCMGAMDQWVVDETGERIETSDRWWFGWGLLLNDDDEYVETAHGVRCQGRFRWLGIFGKDTTHYIEREITEVPSGQ